MTDYNEKLTPESVRDDLESRFPDRSICVTAMHWKMSHCDSFTTYSIGVLPGFTDPKCDQFGGTTCPPTSLEDAMALFEAAFAASL